MGKTISYHANHIIPTEPTEFEQCPFCDTLFAIEPGVRIGSDRPIEHHIKVVHHKVRVRKGSNYKWIDRSEALKHLASEPAA